jgi:hypothetical protein
MLELGRQEGAGNTGQPSVGVAIGLEQGFHLAPQHRIGRADLPQPIAPPDRLQIH